MSPVHVHLLLNHIPVIGVGIGLSPDPGNCKEKADLKSQSATFVLMALFAIPHISPENYRGIVENLPGVSHDFIEEHEDAALYALILIEALGLLSLIAWFSGSEKLILVCLLLSLATLGTMARTAYLGGQVRHSEIRSGDAASSQSHEGETENSD
jgi:hypothetical protein